MCPKSRSKKVLGTIRGAGSFWLTDFCIYSLLVIRSDVYSRVGQLSTVFCNILTNKHPFLGINYTTDFQNGGLDFSRAIQRENWIPVVSNRSFRLPRLPRLKSNSSGPLTNWKLKRRFGFQSANSSAKMDSSRVKQVSFFGWMLDLGDLGPSSNSQFFN